ncbi:hypothetical protein M674_03565 [Neisseria gonorrhoeae SK708]|nr:hypothetical protein M674_03565 [Neisseria gonorrhoeae SK708]
MMKQPRKRANKFTNSRHGKAVPMLMQIFAKLFTRFMVAA